MFCIMIFNRMGNFIHLNFRKAALFMISNQSKELNHIPGSSVQWEASRVVDVRSRGWKTENRKWLEGNMAVKGFCG